MFWVYGVSFSFWDFEASGRPSFLPLALRLAREDLVLSEISFRSISAARENAKAKTLDCISLPRR